ncbi:MAG: UDP-N-acetylmuramoyl-tripeptide--D-alanyl-D-alanine ligase [Bacteroidales bacterium]|nr:UDP-N-acetylmuramoyl-tripeptide--D-alanyl-D-alanine ligase [Bacteroidales bacterium]
MGSLIASGLLLAAFLFLSGCFLPFELRMFQQNSYRPERFWRWWVTEHRLFTAFYNLFDRTPVKIPLAWTARVKRLTVTTVLLTLALLAGGSYALVSAGWSLPWALLVCGAALLLISKCTLLLANCLNAPLEKAIVRWYYNDAKRKLAAHKGLIVIGVTGSYGKTSTKNYLYRILSEKYDTLTTPGNFNTTLGVVRTIREKLEPRHRVFIVEMGAKQRGDIQEICDLVHPTIGIVASVGPMHLETFGSLENIQKTKFELIEALPKEGLGVVNADSPGIASYTGVPTHCRIVRYGVRGGDFRAENVSYSTEGSSFEIEGTSFRTNLLGESNILNIIAACAVARELGVSSKQMQMAVSRLQQVEHRLFVMRRGNYTVIDDAYNSNPEGAAMALDVLRDIAGGQKILLTPGFVELGEKQEEECRKLGRKAAACADILIIVNRLNHDAILAGAMEGIRDGRARLTAETIFSKDDLSQASILLSSLVRPGDVVLYENDLPDTFK